MADTTTSPYGLTLIEVGASDNTWGTKINNNTTAIDNLVDGTTQIKPNLQQGAWKIGGTTITVTGSELNRLDGVTATAAELNILDGVTATAAELNILDGVTASTAELNFSTGVTASIQTQIDAKVAVDGDALTGGFTTTAVNDGTKSSGVYTPTPVGGNMRRIVNAGAFTLTAPTAAGDYTMVIQVTNAAGAGTITLSGFSRSSGDPLSATSGDDFILGITKINGFTLLTVQALQ